MSKKLHTKGCRLGTERCSRSCRTVYEAKDVVLKIRHTDGTETIIKNFGTLENVEYEMRLAPGPDIFDTRGKKP